MEESTDTKRIWGRQTNLIDAIRHGTLEKVIMLISKNQSIVMEENRISGIGKGMCTYWKWHIIFLQLTRRQILLLKRNLCKKRWVPKYDIYAVDEEEEKIWEMLRIGFTKFGDWIERKEEMKKKKTSKMIASFLYWLTVLSKEWLQKRNRLLGKWWGTSTEHTEGEV